MLLSRTGCNWNNILSLNKWAYNWMGLEGLYLGFYGIFGGTILHF